MACHLLYIELVVETLPAARFSAVCMWQMCLWICVSYWTWIKWWTPFLLVQQPSGWVRCSSSWQ